MTAVTRALEESKRSAVRARMRIGQELRDARLKAGLRLVDVARPLGCSAATVSRAESGLASGLTLQSAMQHAAVVGLRMTVNIYPAGAPLRDRGSLKLLNRLEQHVGPAWRWIVEFPVARGDLRAFDAAAIQPTCRVAFDVWPSARDIQAQARASMLKQHDCGVDRLILVFNATRANRRAVREAGESLRRAFPLTTRQILAALRAGRDPGGNGIAFV